MKALLIGLVAAAIFVVGGLRIFGRKLSRLLEVRARKVTDIEGISITLRMNGEPSLFILLAADGTINRMGSGTLDDANRELFNGTGQQQVFEATRSKVAPGILKLCGHFEQSDEFPYELIVRFKFNDGSDSGFGLRYDSDSELPETVRQFVADAMRVTDQWCRDFKDRAQRHPHAQG